MPTADTAETNQPATRRPWWHRSVIYQIWLRSFYDANGDGCGDLAGVIAKLDYLAWLGVDALWLSPLHPSPLFDSGYDVSDYLDVHPDLGDLATFDRLIAEAEQRNIRILLDFVPNHTSDQHPWFLESRRSRDSDKRDWYVWKDPTPEGEPPNNWLAYFGDSVWKFDEQTEQYYLHTFYAEQPDLNWRNPEVRQAMYEVIRFWLERGVAGLRVDGLENMAKDPLFRDEPLDPYHLEHELPRFRMQKIYSVAHPDIHIILREMRQVFDEYHERLFIGEMSYSASMRRTLSYYGHQDYNEVEMPLNFGLINLTDQNDWTARQLQNHINGFDVLTPTSGGLPNYALGNHDKPRLAGRFGEAKRTAAVLLLTLRGTPFIYYGDEIGMEDVDIPLEQRRDRFSIDTPGHDRDGVRTPMRWQNAPHAGFCPPDQTPHLPVGDVPEQGDVHSQQDEPASLLSMYRCLLQYRREQPALTIGDYYPLINLPESVVAYVRCWQDQRVLVVCNFAPEPHTLHFRTAEIAKLVLSTRVERQANTDVTDVDLAALELSGFEAVVLELTTSGSGIPKLADT